MFRNKECPVIGLIIPPRLPIDIIKVNLNMNCTHETPHIFNETRGMSNWLEPPDVVNINDSHLS